MQKDCLQEIQEYALGKALVVVANESNTNHDHSRTTGCYSPEFQEHMAADELRFPRVSIHDANHHKLCPKGGSTITPDVVKRVDFVPEVW